MARISQFWTTAKRMKIDPYCQRQRCNPQNVLSNIVPCVDSPYISSLGSLHARTAVAHLVALVLARLSCTLVTNRQGCVKTDNDRLVLQTRG